MSIDPQKTDQDTPLRSLGLVGYEPIWLFTTASDGFKPFDKGLQGLTGKKVAIGAEGSGTRKVALDLLQSYGVSAANATLSPAGGVAAANALLAKELDAVIIIGAICLAKISTCSAPQLIW